MRADVLHRELLYGRRYGFGTKGPDFKRRHVVTRHFLCTGRVGHHCFQEGGARLKQRDVIALDNGGKAARMGEQRRAFGNHSGHTECEWCGDQIGLTRDPARITDDV